MPDELIGEGDVTKGYYSQEERRAQIMRYLSDGKIRSTSEIAKALKMKPTSKFRKMLLELFAQQRILAYSQGKMYRWQSPKLMQISMFPLEEQEF
jgi:hypothetical protein